MLHGMRPFLLLAAVLVAFHAGPAASEPRCTPQREGEVACLDGKLCECRHGPGRSLSSRPAGMGWNCGALRPACGAAAAPPADAGQPQQPPPFLPAPPPQGWR